MMQVTAQERNYSILAENQTWIQIQGFTVQGFNLVEEKIALKVLETEQL